MSSRKKIASSLCLKASGLAVVCIVLSGCQTIGPNAATGGALGTFAGGVTGAAIGAREGKSPEGALIGALTGGTVGTIAGNAVDRSVEEEQLQFQQAVQQQQLAAVNVDQVVRMTQSGLGSDVIASQIHSQGISHRPTIDELIFLKDQGVDDGVIQAIQSAPVAGHAIPVHRQIIHQPIYHQPVYHRRHVPYYGYGYGGRRHARGPRAGFSVRF